MLDVTDHGTVTLQDDDGNTFKVNGQRLKVFLEPEMPELEEVDVFELSEVRKITSMVLTRPETGLIIG